jgi:hypothetical protein
MKINGTVKKTVDFIMDDPPVLIVDEDNLMYVHCSAAMLVSKSMLDTVIRLFTKEWDLWLRNEVAHYITDKSEMSITLSYFQSIMTDKVPRIAPIDRSESNKEFLLNRMLTNYKISLGGRVTSSMEVAFRHTFGVMWCLDIDKLFLGITITP